MTLDPSRRHPPRPILCASLAVFREGRVLLAERVRPPGAGCFSLPGGLVEIGETLEEAAVREVLEETGVVARVGGFNGHVEVIGHDEAGRVERHFVVASFWGEWVSGEATVGDEARTVLWADPADLGAIPTTDGLLPLLARAVETRRRQP